MTKIIYPRGIRCTIVGIEECTDGARGPGKPVRRLTLDCGHVENCYQQFGENRTHRTGEPRDCYECGVEARREQSHFVGVIGQRIKATVTVTSGHDTWYAVGDEFDDRKRWETLMCDADGNELVVLSTKFFPETGEVLKIEGIVKEHRTETSDIAETRVSIRRCKRLGRVDDDRPATKAPASSKGPTDESLRALGFKRLTPSGKGYGLPLARPPKKTEA